MSGLNQTNNIHLLQLHVLQVPAPNHLRPLPGDDGEDSDGKAAQFHLRAVCNGERFSRLHRHQPLHFVLRQQLRQRDTYELSKRLACQNLMYAYSSLYYLMLIYLFIYLHLLLTHYWIIFSDERDGVPIGKRVTYIFLADI